MRKFQPLMLVFILCFQAQKTDAIEWQRIPSPPVNRALCVTTVPGTNGTDTVYVGTGTSMNRSAGVWSSIDGGQSWILKSGGPQGIPPALSITRLEVDSTNHQHVVVGSYKGVYITHDGGETWTFKGPGGVFGSVTGLLLDSLNPSTYFVGFTFGGFYRTTDDGETWEEKTHLAYVYDVIQNPSDPAILYASIQSYIYVSEDSGDTWETRSYLPAGDLAFEPTPPHDLLAATYDGVFRSTDQGFSWIPTGPNSPISTVIMVESDSLMLVGGNGLFRSTDAGISWTEVDPLFREAGINEIESDPRVTGRIWMATTYKGVHRSDDAGRSWTEMIVGADTAAVCSLTLPAWNPSVLFAGSYAYLARTSDLGETWHSHGGSVLQDEGRVYYKLSFHPEDSLLVLMGAETPFQAGVVNHSEDGGRSWAVVLVGDETENISDVVFHPTRPETAFAALPPEYYRSTNSGLNWNAFPLDPNLHGGNFVFDPFDPDRIFIYGTYTSGGTAIYRSTDGSVSWSPSASGLPVEATIAAMYPAPSKQNTFYLSLVGSSGPVYRSMNGGVTWSHIGDICQSGCQVRDILVHPRDWDILYAVTASGVYISRDGGLNWEDYNDGIDPEAELHSIIADSTVRNKVYLNGCKYWSDSSWVYHRDLEPVRIDDNWGKSFGTLPREYQLSQNYPNPFNPTTTISFDIPSEAGENKHTTLTVYDLRGRHVMTLIDSELEPGTHQVVWDGKNEQGQQVSSGVYLYTLRSGNSTYTKKMAILM